MALYTGCDCPICGRKFENMDDIVVCPVCGSPHHRACYKTVGHCGNEDYHNEGKQWEAPADLQQDETQEIKDVRVCGRCGAENPVGNCFCQACGQRMNGDAAQNCEGQTNQNPFTDFMNQAQIDYSQVLDDGVTVQDACNYVGPNNIPFIMKFKSIATHGGLTFNWCAFAFGFFYCFYRKMYKLGAILLAIYLVMLIPGGYYASIAIKEIITASGGTLTMPLNFVVDGVGFQGMQLISMFTRLITMGTAMLCGFYFNKGYYRSMLNKVKSIRNTGRFAVGSQEYCCALRSSGGVNTGSVLMLIAGIFAVYMIVGYVASFFILA